MGVAFAILFPLGAALIRMGNYKGKFWTHAGVQTLAILLAVVGLGLGVWLAVQYDAVSCSCAFESLQARSASAYLDPLWQADDGIAP